MVIHISYIYIYDIYLTYIYNIYIYNIYIYNIYIYNIYIYITCIYIYIYDIYDIYLTYMCIYIHIIWYMCIHGDNNVTGYINNKMIWVCPKTWDELQKWCPLKTTEKNEVLNHELCPLFAYSQTCPPWFYGYRLRAGFAGAESGVNHQIVQW